MAITIKEPQSDHNGSNLKQITAHLFDSHVSQPFQCGPILQQICPAGQTAHQTCHQNPWSNLCQAEDWL